MGPPSVGASVARLNALGYRVCIQPEAHLDGPGAITHVRLTHTDPGHLGPEGHAWILTSDLDDPNDLQLRHRLHQLTEEAP